MALKPGALAALGVGRKHSIAGASSEQDGGHAAAMRRSRSDDREPKVSPVVGRLGRRESLAVPTGPTGPTRPVARAAATGVQQQNARAAAGEAAAASGAAALAMAREVEDLKGTVKVLEKKRQDDREKLKALERVQVERDKFQMIIEKLQGKTGTLAVCGPRFCSFKLQQPSTNRNKPSSATAANNSKT